MRTMPHRDDDTVYIDYSVDIKGRLKPVVLVGSDGI